MGSLSPALELLRNLVARLGAASAATDARAAVPLLPAEADAKLQGVLRALSRAIGDDDAAHVAHSALFAAWQPVAASGACRAFLAAWPALWVAHGLLTPCSTAACARMHVYSQVVSAAATGLLGPSVQPCNPTPPCRRGSMRH